jgi:hypothetical protein
MTAPQPSFFIPQLFHQRLDRIGSQKDARRSLFCSVDNDKVSEELARFSRGIGSQKDARRSFLCSVNNDKVILEDTFAGCFFLSKIRLQTRLRGLSTKRKTTLASGCLLELLCGS